MKQYGYYTSDDGVINCALLLDVDTLRQMGFFLAPIGTPNRPQKLLTRKEVFFNSDGKRLRLPYPTTTPPISLGATVTLRGDPSYTAVETLDEINRGES